MSNRIRDDRLAPEALGQCLNLVGSGTKLSPEDAWLIKLALLELADIRAQTCKTCGRTYNADPRIEHVWVMCPILGGSIDHLPEWFGCTEWSKDGSD